MITIFCYLALLISASLALYPSSSDVVDLTPANFDRLVIQSDSVWIVEFYAPWCGHCKQFVPEYSKAATALKGVMKVGAVNVDEHKSLGGQYGVKGFPSVKLFRSEETKPQDYSGPRTAQGLVDAGLAAVRSKVMAQLGGKAGSSKADLKDVVQLTDSNFDKLVLQSEDLWLVEFYAPWCGHCKNLEPQWAQAASQLKGKVKLGALDATVHTGEASRYGVQGYPTIKMFPAGRKDESSVSDYNGGRTANDIVSWALDQLAETLPAPEVVQLADLDSLKLACEGKPLCVVSVLPHILDCQSRCRQSYLNTLAEMADKYKRKLWGWVWSEAGAQVDLEAMLEIGGFGYPAMAVVNARKMKYSLLRGSFSTDGINEFLRDLSFGRGSTAPIKGAALPAITQTLPWDGKDGELPQEEDEDLSDVDLNDLEDKEEVDLNDLQDKEEVDLNDLEKKDEL